MGRLLILIIILLISFGVQAAEPSLLINEIAWMGTADSYANEWIELYNNSEEKIDLENWQLMTADKDLAIGLEGVVEPHSFFILERTDEETLPKVEADQIYHGSLNNNGQYLKLVKKDQIIQEINDKAGWRAGNSEEYKTMERGEEWHSSRKAGGTPGTVNSEPVSQEEQMPAQPLTASLPQKSHFWFTFLVALGISFFSASVFYYLKKELGKS